MINFLKQKLPLALATNIIFIIAIFVFVLVSFFPSISIAIPLILVYIVITWLFSIVLNIQMIKSIRYDKNLVNRNWCIINAIVSIFLPFMIYIAWLLILKINKIPKSTNVTIIYEARKICLLSYTISLAISEIMLIVSAILALKNDMTIDIVWAVMAALFLIVFLISFILVLMAYHNNVNAKTLTNFHGVLILSILCPLLYIWLMVSVYSWKEKNKHASNIIKILK